MHRRQFAIFLLILLSAQKLASQSDIPAQILDFVILKVETPEGENLQNNYKTPVSSPEAKMEVREFRSPGSSDTIIGFHWCKGGYPRGFFPLELIIEREPDNEAGLPPQYLFHRSKTLGYAENGKLCRSESYVIPSEQVSFGGAWTISVYEKNKIIAKKKFTLVGALDYRD